MNRLRSNTWRLWREMRPYSGYLAALLLFSLLGTPLALLTPLPLKIVVDNVIGSRPLPHFLGWLPATIRGSEANLLVLALGLLIAVALVGQLREFTSSFLTAYTGEKMLREFRAKLFRHLQRLSLSYHDNQGTADSIYRIQYDATALQNIVVVGIVPFFSSAITLIAMIFVTARISWKFALVGVAIAPFVLWASGSYRRWMRSQSRKVRNIESSALSVVQEVLGSVRVVRAFGQEEREHKRFMQRSKEGMRERLHQEKLQGGYGIVLALLTALGTASVLYIGVHDIKAGKLTLGSLLLVMGYLGQLYGPLRTVGKKMASMQTYFVGAERAFALLDEAVDVEERPHARPLAHASGAMIFQHVSFAYDGARPVLEDISFEVKPGCSVGIVGTTGAGKTTLVNLLTRFYDPTGGQILLDGVDLRDYKLSDLRNQFAMVLQEPLLFSTSIAENIAYARASASQAEIEAAAKAANAHNFIIGLPQAYQTVVGERGMRLSGGERQRISIARAFLKDAPILILDEPTSSVDVRTEAAILEALERLARGRTTFVITHRLSALQQSDLIVRIEKGRLVAIDPGARCEQFAAVKREL
ncbi:MAG: ABC transporter ATP-binding protein [Acidobacteria bacterium]|nr:MAG: ABC transporter ATP-binding protein [Acidobacteriota bacterium]